MPNTRAMYPPSKYLGAQDFPQPVIATIAGVSPENFKAQGQREAETRWVLYFKELPKGLKLNTTNIKTLEAGFGEESDLWVGKRVKVFNDPTIQMAGKTVGGVRLKCPSAPAVVLGAAAALPAGARFDPHTGQPLVASAAPAGPRFDSMTGQPLNPAVDASTGEVRDLSSFNSPPGKLEEFDDDIPF